MRSLYVGAALCAFTGCSSLKGRYVPPGAPPSVQVAKGVTYYLSGPSFAVQRKTLHAGKPAAPVFELVQTSAPDYSKRFEVGLKAGLFSSDTFEVKLATNSTLESLSATSEDVTGPVVAKLAELGAEAASGVLAIEGAEPHDPGKNVENAFKDAMDTKLAGGEPVLSKADADKAIAAWKDANRDAAELKGVALDHVKTAVTALLDYLRGSKAGNGELAAVLPSLEAYDAALGVAASGPISPNLHDNIQEQIAEAMKDVVDLESVLSVLAKSTAKPSVSNTLKSLKKDVDVALAAALENSANLDPANPIPKDSELDKALEAYRNGIDLLVAAHERVHGGALASRRTKLVDSLKNVPDPVGPLERTAYVQLAEELGRVQSAIDALVGSGGGTKAISKSPILATQVTSRVDSDIHFVRFTEELEPEVRERFRLIAAARVRFGGASAALFADPLLPRVPAEDKAKEGQAANQENESTPINDVKDLSD